MNKERYYYTHTLERMEERYGVLLYKVEYDTMCNLVTNGKGIYGDRLTKEKELWFIQFMGRILPVVYDRTCSKIVTVLPSNRKKPYNIKDSYSEQEWIRLTYTDEDDQMALLKYMQQYKGFCISCWSMYPCSGMFCMCEKER